MKLLSKVFRQVKNPADEVMLRLLEQSAEDAGYWAKRMPREAARLVQRVRMCTLVSAVVSLTTGLLVWPVIAGSSQFSAQVVVSVLSGLAAFAMIAPHVSGLSDRADESIKLCSAYSAVYGDLLDARNRIVSGNAADLSYAADIARRFQYIEERKDALALPAEPGRAVAVADRSRRDGLRTRIISGRPLKAERLSAPYTAIPLENGRTTAVGEGPAATALVHALTRRAASPQLPSHHDATPRAVDVLPVTPLPGPRP